MAITHSTNFDDMYKGSFYTICGAGGDLSEWESGYNEMMEKEGIGTPQAWFSFTGKEINNHYHLKGDNRFKNNLHFLCFPLDGLNIGKLAVFRLKMEDKWFDDIVDNSVEDEYEQEAI